MVTVRSTRHKAARSSSYPWCDRWGELRPGLSASPHGPSDKAGRAPAVPISVVLLPLPTCSSGGGDPQVKGWREKYEGQAHR